jgi:hypothetical protein
MLRMAKSQQCAPMVQDGKKQSLMQLNDQVMSREKPPVMSTNNPDNPYLLRNCNLGPVQSSQPNLQSVPTSDEPAQSTREIDPFTQLASQRPSYPKLPDPSPKRPFFYQVSWRIHISNDMESPEKGLIDGISEIWAVLKSVDDKIIIYPWKQMNHGRYKAPV